MLRWAPPARVAQGFNHEVCPAFTAWQCAISKTNGQRLLYAFDLHIHTRICLAFGTVIDVITWCWKVKYSRDRARQIVYEDLMVHDELVVKPVPRPDTHGAEVRAKRVQ